MKFFVHGLPIAQPRQRHRVAMIHGKPIAVNYTPDDSPVNLFKASIRMAYLAVKNERSWDHFGPIAISVGLIFPRPKSMTKRHMPNLQCPKKSKPDIENIGKAIFDALTGLAYNDDAQISRLTMTKRIAGDGDEVGCLIEIGSDD